MITSPLLHFPFSHQSCVFLLVPFFIGTPPLSWFTHTTTICSKACKILGIIFRLFYSHSSPSTLIKHYISLVCPHLEYCSVVWDPSAQTLKCSMESIQRSVSKLASKFCPQLISSLQSHLNLPSLASHHSYAKLIPPFELFYKLIHFSSPIICPNPTPPYSIKCFHPNNFLHSNCKISSFLNSYFPFSISL